MKKILTSLACAAIAAGAYAEVKNGSYEGTMKCEAMLANVAQGPWTQPIQLNIAGTSISWTRSDGRYIESGSGTLQAGRLSLSLDGRWNEGVNKTKNWRTIAMLNLEGTNLIGPATIFSVDGQQRVRDCTVTVPVNMDQSVQIKPDAIPAVNSRSAAQFAQQIGNTTKQAIPAMLGQVIGQMPSTGLATGPMFNTKAQFLEKTRSGQFLDLKKIGSDEQIAFSKSVQAVLTNDYGINNWPTERAVVDGVVVSRIDSACKAEFEGNVKRIFVSTVSANTSMLTNRPPEFNGTEQDLRIAKRSVDDDVSQLMSQRDGWCVAKGTTHPYLTALPRLLSEFNTATAQAVNERRSRLQVQYQQDVDAEAAKNRANDEVKWAESAKKASVENAQREKELTVKVKREARERGAASRNQQQISALGFPSHFMASTLYVNFMGQWSSFMPCGQWLGLLIENKKIASIQTITVRGYPGVSIKRTGQPAVGIVFRMEGKEAYAFAMVVDGRLEQIQSPADHSRVALMVKALTIEEATN